MIQVSAKDFDRAVNRALDQVPDQFLALLENVVVLVEDDPPEDEADLLGIYEGIPLTERDSHYGLVPPDRITLYRNPLMSASDSIEELIEEIGVTVVHEIGHYFGIDDDELDELGWG